MSFSFGGAARTRIPSWDSARCAFAGIRFANQLLSRSSISKKKNLCKSRGFSFWRRHPDSNWGIADLQSAALPLGYGAIYGICGPFVRKSVLWSGLRGSNSLPPPWQGGALPDELKPQNGASGQSRTGDTRIFSPLLYLLSYRGRFCEGNMVGTTGLEPVTPCL